MTTTENIFLAWALFSGGVTLLVATLILLFNATRHGRLREGSVIALRFTLLIDEQVATPAALHHIQAWRRLLIHC
jgi:hypothetical protein